mgnify:CR=1 FL=1
MEIIGSELYEFWYCKKGKPLQAAYLLVVGDAILRLVASAFLLLKQHNGVKETSESTFSNYGNSC